MEKRESARQRVHYGLRKNGGSGRLCGISPVRLLAHLSSGAFSGSRASKNREADPESHSVFQKCVHRPTNTAHVATAIPLIRCAKEVRATNKHGGLFGCDLHRSQGQIGSGLIPQRLLNFSRIPKFSLAEWTKSSMQLGRFAIFG